MKLSEIVKRTIRGMSNVTVDVNEKYGYITITNGTDEIFLQGDDFNSFMSEVDAIKDEEISYGDKLLFVAEQYTSVLWEN